jgi:hypothetical protein
MVLWTDMKGLNIGMTRTFVEQFSWYTLSEHAFIV